MRKSNLSITKYLKSVYKKIKTLNGASEKSTRNQELTDSLEKSNNRIKVLTDYLEKSNNRIRILTDSLEKSNNRIGVVLEQKNVTHNTLLSVIEERDSALNQIKLMSSNFASTNGYIHLYTQWVDYWKSYISNHNIDKKLEEFTKNLDDESASVSRNFVNVYLNFVPNSQEFTKCLYSSDIIYTKYEQQQILNYYESNYVVPEKFKFPDDIVLKEKEIFYNEGGLKFLPDFVKKNLAGKLFIDGGAFCGDTALVLNEFNPKQIVCYEPNKYNYEILNKVIEINNLSNVSTVLAALGETKGSQELSVYNNDKLDLGSSLLNNDSFDKHLKADSYVVDIETIDDISNPDNLEVGLIKLDVEGFELEVIRGALKTIKKDKPVLILSIYHHPKDFFGIKPLLEELELGYKFKVKRVEYTTFTACLNLICWVE